MEIVWNVPLKQTPKHVLLNAGYHEFTDHKTKHHSFIHRLGKGHYPRFHVYLKEKQWRVIIDLHIDQKKTTAFNPSRHAGEYEGEVVEEEAARLIRWFGHYT